MTRERLGGGGESIIAAITNDDLRSYKGDSRGWTRGPRCDTEREQGPAGKGKGTVKWRGGGGVKGLIYRAASIEINSPSAIPFT